MAKILLVEDDKSLREIYGVRLMAEGYEIVSAGDGEEALALAIKDHPDLIISDVMMPKISGFDMLDILRSTAETKSVKVIMMTALSSEDQRARGESLGADRYLVKSQVGIEDVVRTVHEVLADSPVAATPRNSFATPTPTAAPRPAPVLPASRPETVASSSIPAATSIPVTTPAVAPIAPVSEPAPAIPSAPFVPPAAPAEPVAPAPAFIPTPITVTAPTAAAPLPSSFSPLPEPTAPFSTPAPASLSNTVNSSNTTSGLEPLPASGAGPADFSALMNQELSAAGVNPTPLSAPVTVPVTAPAESTVPPVPVAPLAPPVPPLPPVPSVPPTPGV